MEPIQAIILAGGKGERLWPLTSTRPKVMVEVRGKPLLRHHLGWLAGEGITDAVLACGYMSETIAAYLAIDPVPKLRVFFSVEGEPLGRGGGLRKAAAMLPFPSQSVIVTHGDTISDMPLAEAYRFHCQRGMLLTLLLVPYRSQHTIVEITNAGVISAFREKPRLPYWAHASAFIASPEFFPLLPEKGEENAVFDELARQGRIAGFRTDHYYRSVDTLKDLKGVEADLALLSLPHEDVFSPL